MSLFKNIIGYDLHTSRLVFDFDGVEIVFIHDFCLLKRRVYVDGELVFNRHSHWLGFITDTEFEHNGRHFRIISRILNWLTMKQDVTVWVNGGQAGRKVDRFYAALSTPKKLHALFGMSGLGLIIGITASSFGSMVRKVVEAIMGA